MPYNLEFKYLLQIFIKFFLTSQNLSFLISKTEILNNYLTCEESALDNIVHSCSPHLIYLFPTEFLRRKKENVFKNSISNREKMHIQFAIR